MLTFRHKSEVKENGVKQIENIYKERGKKNDNRHLFIKLAIQDLKDTKANVSFVKKERKEYPEIFEDIQTATSLCDDFVKQLKLFSEKQDIHNIKPKGIQKIVLLKE